MGSRGKRGRAIIREPSPDRVAGFEHIAFTAEPHRVRFLQLLNNATFRPTRFLSHSTLVTLGLSDSLRRLFVGTGIEPYYSMQELTYKDLTLEFLSSFSFDPRLATVYFRLRNTDYNMSLQAWGIKMGFVWDPTNDTPPETYDHSDLWEEMTRDRTRDTTYWKVGSIEDPRLRLYMRFLNSTLFAKASTDKVSLGGMFMLSAFLNPDRTAPFTAAIPEFVATHFERISKGRIRFIGMGGLITALAKRLATEAGTEFSTTLYAPESELVPVFNLDHLKGKQKWVAQTGSSYRWNVTERRQIPLPCPSLPPLVALPEAMPGDKFASVSYLIPPELEVGYRAPPQGGEASTSRAPPRVPTVSSMPVMPTPPLTDTTTHRGVDTEMPDQGGMWSAYSFAPPTAPVPTPPHYPGWSDYENLCFQMQHTGLHMQQHGLLQQQQLGYQQLHALDQQGFLQPSGPIPAYYDPRDRSYHPEHGVGAYDLSAFHPPPAPESSSQPASPRFGPGCAAAGYTYDWNSYVPDDDTEY